MREYEVEKYLHKCVEEMGGTTYKWVSPQHNGVPDRILFHPYYAPCYIEVKRKGKLPKPHQWREIIRLKNMGAVVGYLAGVEEVDNFISKYKINGSAIKNWLWDHVIENIPENYLK